MSKLKSPMDLKREAHVEEALFATENEIEAFIELLESFEGDTGKSDKRINSLKKALKIIKSLPISST